MSSRTTWLCQIVQRSSGCLIAEECADYALRLKDGIDADTLMYLLAADKITTGQDMPDEVRAKLHKAIGYGYDQSGRSNSRSKNCAAPSN